MSAAGPAARGALRDAARGALRDAGRGALRDATRGALRRARAAAICTCALLPAGLLAGCETTAEKSARLERQARLTRHAGGTGGTPKAIVRESALVRVVGTAVVHTSEGTAAVVSLRNTSSRTLTDLPIAVTVLDAQGHTLSANDTPGLEAALTSVPELPPRGELDWIDDQLPDGGSPAKVGARVGEGSDAASSAGLPTVSGVHLIEDPSNGLGAAGTVRSPSTRHHLVVFALARRGGRIVAAGRAVLSDVPAGQSVPFQAFLVGEPRGAALQAQVG